MVVNTVPGGKSGGVPLGNVIDVVLYANGIAETLKNNESVQLLLHDTRKFEYFSMFIVFFKYAT